MNTDAIRVHPDADGEGVELHVSVPAECLPDFRLMLREQLMGDHEQLRFAREHGYGRRKTDPPHLAPERLERRIAFVERLAEAVGGLYALLPVPALLLALQAAN